MKRKASGIVIALTLLLATAAAFADFCPPIPPPCAEGPADDATTSLGSFRIVVAPKWRADMAAHYPPIVYNPTTHRLQSPDLFDGNTTIGRSATHDHGTAADLTGGVPVGTANRMVSDASFTLQPPGFQGPNGEHEVHTNVETLNMTMGGGAPYVRAGTAASTFVLSPGEVESKPGDAFPDFPAESFFDVFVEVGLPSMGIPGWPDPVVLKNNAPLLVQNADLTDFPPRVVYIHGNSSAVPVVFRDANPGKWTAGEIFGDLVLAGHGLNFDSSRSDVAEFDTIMAAQREIPYCECPCAGDPNCDSVINVQDVVAAVAVAFRGAAPTVDPDCPRERTDVNCSGVTDVIDVTKVVGVAFRGGNPATEFCDPCA